MVIVIVMLERKIPVKARQPMEQSACHDQVYVLVVQNHQLKLTNNSLACLSRSTGVIILYNVCVYEYYNIPHAFVLYTCIVVGIIAYLMSLMTCISTCLFKVTGDSSPTHGHFP